MGKLPERLMLRKGMYYHRVRVPADIVESYAKVHGRRVEIESLKTKDPRQARELLPHKMIEVNAKFEAHRKMQDASATVAAPLPTLSFAEIARQHARDVSDKEFADRAALFEAAHGDSSRLWKGELVNLPQSQYFDHLVEDGDLDQIVGYITRTRVKDRVAALRRMLAIGDLGELSTIALEHSPGIDPARQLVLARLVARAEIDALQAIAAGEPDAGVESAAAAPVEPLEWPDAAVALVSQKSGSGPRLSLVMADWIAEKARTNAWREKTRLEREANVKSFIEVVGDHPIGNYGKADAKRFKDILFNIPPNAHKKAAYKGLDLVAIAEKAEAAGDQKPTAKNVALKMDAVSALFFWARKNFDEVTTNPFEGVKPQVDTVAREERDPFSLGELKAIFASPPFTGAKSETHWLQPGDEVLGSSGKFWVPLIAAYTGARLMEIVQLQKADVQTIGDVTFINLTTDGGDKWLKTRGAKRRIPVHPALVKAGFLDLVAKVKNPADRLFPDIEIGDAKNRSSPASKLFVRLIRAAGVKSRKNCFHSFRHSFEDACRDAEVDSGVMNALQGHVERGMAGRYGSGFKLERLNAEMQKIRYGLVFEG